MTKVSKWTSNQIETFNVRNVKLELQFQLKWLLVLCAIYQVLSDNYKLLKMIQGPNKRSCHWSKREKWKNEVKHLMNDLVVS